MIKLLGDEPLRHQLRRPVVALGVFDGVHLGHQKVINQAVEWAHDTGSDAAVITFDAAPLKPAPGETAPLITSLEHRLVLFERLGVDATLVLHSGGELLQTSAEQFLREVVAGRLGAKGLVLGFDQRFGRGREGDAALAGRVGGEIGLEVRVADRVDLDGLIISSTAIREAILAGALDDAARMLGRPVSVLGTVVRATGKGHRLGFPTANLDLHHEIRPPQGVYRGWAVISSMPAQQAALINIGPGSEPGDEQPIVEVHILDFDGELYGETLEARFIEKLREEIIFEDDEALRAQIARDAQRARTLFGDSRSSG